MDDIKPVIKAVFVGDSGVGKTYFITQFCSDEKTTPIDDHVTTIGIDCQTNDFTHYNKNTYKIQLWDTSGCERFRSITKSFFRKADLTVIMVDLSRPSEEVHNSIVFWKRQMTEIVQQDVPVFVIGNKKDLMQHLDRDCDDIERQIVAKNKNEVNDTMHNILIEFINNHPLALTLTLKHVVVEQPQSQHNQYHTPTLGTQGTPGKECCVLL